MIAIRRGTWLVGGSFLFALGACSPSASEESMPQDTSSHGGAVEIARFRLGEGREARFLAVGDAEGVLFEETGPEATTPLVSPFEDQNAVDIYLALAPETSPIPNAIAALAGDAQREALGHREKVEALAEPIVVANAPAALRALGHSSTTGTWSCSGGASAFESFACEGSGSPDREFCDSGQWYNLARNSGDSRVKTSLGVFVACGTHVQITHQYRDCCSDWRDLHSTWIPGGYWMSSKYTGLAKWRRRIAYDRVYQPDGSHLRAYSAFY